MDIAAINTTTNNTLATILRYTISIKWKWNICNFVILLKLNRLLSVILKLEVVKKREINWHINAFQQMKE